MKQQYILTIDQSTSGTKLLIIDVQGQVIIRKAVSHEQIYPQSGWVEHNPIEIYENVKQLMKEIIDERVISVDELKVLTITNQRETIVVWDKKTGKPVYNAIVWQCRRTTSICEDLKVTGYGDLIQEKTGLIIDPYFSASKIKWILENVSSANEKADKGELLLGTVDSWLIWKLTNGKVHATDVTNASRTLLYNIENQNWDDELLRVFNIPKVMLPEVKYSDDLYGTVEVDELSALKLPISGVIGDSQAALFGQQCFKKGLAKATFGTGTSVMIYTDVLKKNKSGLVSTVAWGLNGKVDYAQEGIIHMTGDVIKWLKEDLGLINDLKEAESLAKSLPDNQGVYLIPAFVGLGAPYWSPETRAAIVGMNRNTEKKHIIRAALESIVYQVKDVIKFMQIETNIQLEELRVDGGATSNKFLMQYLADVLGIDVIVSSVEELSAKGSAIIGGLGFGIWESTDEINMLTQNNRVYKPILTKDLTNKYYLEWKEYVARIICSK